MSRGVGEDGDSGGDGGGNGEGEPVCHLIGRHSEEVVHQETTEDPCFSTEEI